MKGAGIGKFVMILFYVLLYWFSIYFKNSLNLLVLTTGALAGVYLLYQL